MPKLTLQQEVLDLTMEIVNEWDTIYATGQSNGVPNSDGTYGFNSPGLVKYVFNTVMQAKVPFYQLSPVLDTLYTTTSLYNAGYPSAFSAHTVAKANMEPGDVLFFGSSSPTYCGIYLGNGEFVYVTSAWAEGVCIMPLAEYQDELIAVRRYLPETAAAANKVMTVNGPYKTYKIYAAKSASASVVATPAQGSRITVLYTDNDSWALVKTSGGTIGYFMTKYLS